jgi:hypothetical protein
MQVIIAKLQRIVVNEFLPVLADLREEELRAWEPLSDKPDISVEVRCTCRSLFLLLTTLNRCSAMPPLHSVRRSRIHDTARGR